MEPNHPRSDDLIPAPIEAGESPRHGFQGNRTPPPPPSGIPAGLTIAISREAGSRGGTIGRRVGRKLGWPVYDQEVLEYTAQEGTFRQDFLENLPPAAMTWAEERLQELLRSERLGQHPSIVNLARVVLALGAQGGVVLIGRGAGCILPPATTLHVRVVAPLADRIAYLAQWARLTVEEATERVRLRDSRRAEFLATHFRRQPGDIYQYDLLLNSSLLGEELCAELIVQAARAKWAARPDARVL
ncbi:MAG TPA: cytidylate kinase-like family protein [Gemmataceae bacterium]|jgi:cytidylate kinase|nr:cytidylate kinase-like family protein [Gemmataceae bacterium]